MNTDDAPLGKKNLEHELVEHGPVIERRPQSLELVFWDAFALATNGCVPESLPLFREVFSKDPGWVLVLKRLLRSERIEDHMALSAILAGTGAEESAAASRLAS